jgi:hypothetical protein
MATFKKLEYHCSLVKYCGQFQISCRLCQREMARHRKGQATIFGNRIIAHKKNFWKFINPSVKIILNSVTKMWFEFCMAYSADLTLEQLLNELIVTFLYTLTASSLSLVYLQDKDVLQKVPTLACVLNKHKLRSK